MRRLSDNELLALVKRLCVLYKEREGDRRIPIDDAGIERFVRCELARAGADEMVTPREFIRDFLMLLNILRDNESVSLDELISRIGEGRGGSADIDEPAISDLGAENSESPAPRGETKKPIIGLFDIEI